MLCAFYSARLTPSSTLPALCSPMKRRVVVTGIGAVTSLSCKVDDLWERILRGESGIHELKAFDTAEHKVKFGGDIHDWSTEGYVERKEGWVVPKEEKDEPWVHGLKRSKSRTKKVRRRRRKFDAKLLEGLPEDLANAANKLLEKEAAARAEAYKVLSGATDEAVLVRAGIDIERCNCDTIWHWGEDVDRLHALVRG